MLKNKMGLTASDIVDGIPKDLNSLEIQIILMSNGFKSDKKDTDIITAQAATTSTEAVEEAVTKAWKKCWRKMVKLMRKWFEHNGKWFEEMRGNLSTVATLISTMTFQSVLNPPGSFIQQNIISDSSQLECMDKENDYACPGHSVLASRDSDAFRFFIFNNTVAFAASLGVTVLLISGLPLEKMVVMGMLSIGMCITFMALARAHFMALFMKTPEQLWDLTGDEMIDIVDCTWTALFALAGGYILLSLVIWLLKHCVKHVKRIRVAIHARRHRHLPQAQTKIWILVEEVPTFRLLSL